MLLVMAQRVAASPHERSLSSGGDQEERVLLRPPMLRELRSAVAWTADTQQVRELRILSPELPPLSPELPPGIAGAIAYRFNRRFDLQALPTRLLVAAVTCAPRPEPWIRRVADVPF